MASLRPTRLLPLALVLLLVAVPCLLASAPPSKADKEAPTYSYPRKGRPKTATAPPSLPPSPPPSLPPSPPPNPPPSAGNEGTGTAADKKDEKKQEKKAKKADQKTKKEQKKADKKQEKTTKRDDQKAKKEQRKEQRKGGVTLTPPTAAEAASAESIKEDDQKEEKTAIKEASVATPSKGRPKASAGGPRKGRPKAAKAPPSNASKGNTDTTDSKDKQKEKKDKKKKNNNKKNNNNKKSKKDREDESPPAPPPSIFPFFPWNLNPFNFIPGLPVSRGLMERSKPSSRRLQDLTVSAPFKAAAPAPHPAAAVGTPFTPSPRPPTPPPPGAIVPGLLSPSLLKKFVDPLVIPPVLNGSTQGVVLNMGMYRTTHRYHQDLPLSTVYAYGATLEAATVPGPTIEAIRGIDTLVSWHNNINDTNHLFTVDFTLRRAQPPLGGVPCVVHRHGGLTEPQSNGHPDAWFTWRGDTGPAFTSSVYNYSNDQYPATLWYHDQTFGWVRLNSIAGLAGLYIIRDPTGIEHNLTLPSGKYEIPLIIEDKSFWPNGSIYYPDVGVTTIHPNWRPTYEGNLVVVNGKVWPILEAERTAYRFRVLDSANSRFFNLSFVCAAPEDYPDFLLPLKGTAYSFTQVGSMGGYLNKPVQLDYLFMGPGERYDIIVDFSTFPSTCNDVIVINTSPALNPRTPADNYTGTVMRIQLSGNVLDPYVLPFLPQTVARLDASNDNTFRILDLFPISTRLTSQPVVYYLGGHTWLDPPTERVFYKSEEVWTLVNAMETVHTMHLHLAQFRMMSRQPINRTAYFFNDCALRNATRPTCFLGPPTLPFANEAGWLDTVKALPEAVTTFVVRWLNQSGGAYPFDPTAEPQYAWHTSIAERVDNIFLRPLVMLNRPEAELANWNETRETAFPPEVSYLP